MGKPASSTLWGLILGTVVFLSVFVAMTTLVPPEAMTETPYKDYEDVYLAQQDLRASDIVAWNQTDEFNVTDGNYWKNYEGLDILFSCYFNSPSAWFIRIRRVKWRLLGTPITWDAFFTEDGSDRLYAYHILDEYSNESDSSEVHLSSVAISFDIVFESNSSGSTLPECIYNNLPIKLSINYEIDFTQMGANIWGILGMVFTYQAIRTGSTPIDLILNAIVCLPIYTSIAYTIYKIVAGLIPFASGGGGG